MTPPNSSMPDSPSARVSLAPSSGKAWSSVSRTGPEDYRIRLEGPFGPSWIASLCAELADRRISIDRAHAMRTSNQTWVAELGVIALEGAQDPLSIPYVELAEAGAPSASDPLALLDFEVLETSAHGGSLQLTIHAVDSLGLLGSLLGQLAMLFLFPVEMHIETRNGRAHDVFWLCTVGASPGARLRDALQRVLARAQVGA